MTTKVISNDEKLKLDDRLDELEMVLIPELEQEAYELRQGLEYAESLTLTASQETVRLLHQLMEEWGDDKHTALMRCVQRAHYSEFGHF